MITTSGKNFIKRYLAGQAGQMVGAISVGVGSTAAAVGDTRLKFEFGRVPVDVIAYDFENDRLVFKGTLEADVSGVIYEVGLWTSEFNASAGSLESSIITSFDSETEDWSVETFTTSDTRIGEDSLLLTPSASATNSSTLTGISADLIDYSSQDLIVLAYNVGNSNTANIKVRLRTDASNYYEFTITSPSTGYKTDTFTLGSATVVGTPDWGDISEVVAEVTATGGGSASVSFDGLRVESVDTLSPEYGLIARFIPASPVVKTEGIEQDIEYTLPVTI